MAAESNRYSEGGIEFMVIADGGLSCWPPEWRDDLPPLEKKGEGVDATWWATLNIEGLSVIASFDVDGAQVKVKQGQLIIKIFGGYDEC